MVAPASAEQRNPFESDEAAIRIGNTLFANRCALCHGADAKGSLGPDLTQRWARGASDESAFNIIRNGVPGSSMPPNAAPDNELWAIVAYLRSVSVMPPLVTSGDVARGRSLFANECSSCHQVSGSGGVLGPDLTGIGAARSRVALTAALREPSATVALGFRAATAVTRSRRASRGRRQGRGCVFAPDRHRLRRAARVPQARARRAHAQPESLMPAYDASKLSDAALEDLLAYLGTLRGAEANP